MRHIILCLSFISIAWLGTAQDAEIDVAGLTCSLCSRHVENALSRVEFISAVEADLQNATYNVSFLGKTTDQLYKVFDAVEKSGFSVVAVSIKTKFLSPIQTCLSKPIRTDDEEVKLVKYKKSSKNNNDCKYWYEVL